MLRRSMVARASTALALVAFAWLAPAQAAVDSPDHRFMAAAAAGGMEEIVLGRVAQEKAASDAVRQFGARMVDEHVKANEELKSLAASKGVPIPTGLSSDQKAAVSHMKKLKGPNFDRVYMARMIEDHRKTVALFETASAGAGDADVKAYAAHTLPGLRSHLELAQQTESALSLAGSKGKAAGAIKPVTRE